MNKHIHISALEGFINALYVILLIGAMHIIARKYEGHPLANTVLDIWA